MRLIDADQFGVVSFQGKSEDFIEGVCFILDKIYEAPTVEQRTHGKWIKQFDVKTQYYTCTCSVCGDTHRLLINYFLESNFCPKCGSDMREGEKE